MMEFFFTSPLVPSDDPVPRAVQISNNSSVKGDDEVDSFSDSLSPTTVSDEDCGEKGKLSPRFPYATRNQQGFSFEPSSSNDHKERKWKTIKERCGIIITVLALGVGFGVGLNKRERYSNCKALDYDELNGKLGDGKCDLTSPSPDNEDTYLNRKECGWDGGDCNEWNTKYMACVPGTHPSELKYFGTTNYCRQEYNREECGYDDGNCLELNKKIDTEFPGCKADSLSDLGDSKCQYALNIAECKYDNGDCEDFNKRYPNCQPDYSNGNEKYGLDRPGNGFCDSAFNNESCGYDDGDCEMFNKYPDCAYRHRFSYQGGYHEFQDGHCNYIFDSEECGWDGGDCS